MKKMKRTLALFCSAMMLTAGAMTFVACSEDEEKEKTVMNVSCNPSVEFVLDTDNKVISVNALNEEGNLVLNGEVFVGLSAEEAGKLFVSVSKDMGFIVEGDLKVADNEISVSFSGDAASKLYDDVKGKIDEYLTAENITATVQKAEAITEAHLETLVAECAPYLEKAEIEAMKQAELIEMLYESRKETAEYYSQELKNAYYETKAFILEQAEVDVLKSKLNSIAQAALQVSYDLYTQSVEKIEQIRIEQFLAEDSTYQQKLAEFREKKIQYLQYREQVAQMEESAYTDTIKGILKGYETAVDTAEQLLLTAGELANGQLDTAKTAAKTAYNGVVSAIEQTVTRSDEILTEISTRQQTAKQEFFTKFEADYAAMITKAETDWATMKSTLENKSTPGA